MTMRDTMRPEGLWWVTDTASRIANLSTSEVYPMPGGHHVQMFTRSAKGRHGFEIYKNTSVIAYALNGNRLHCETGPARVAWGAYSDRVVAEWWLDGKFWRGMPAAIADVAGVADNGKFPFLRFLTLDSVTPLDWAPEGFELEVQMRRLENKC